MPITRSAAAAAFAAALAIATLPPMAHAQLSETAAFASHLQNQYRIVPNITYLTANNWEAKLDLYLPREGAKPNPTLIYIHGGGWIADYIVDWLNRPLLMAAMTREGKDNYIPWVIFGPKVMLINQYAGSGGDALPWMFKELGIGPLIGTRTWGGLIGIGGYPPLMDGGAITAPRWGLFNPKTGEFERLMADYVGVRHAVAVDNHVFQNWAST